MTKPDEAITAKLKAIIDEKGPKYLADEPYRVYKDLISSDGAGKKIAGAVLYILVSDVLPEDTNDDFELLSGNIQKNCGLNKQISDRLAGIFGCLYSKDNKESWKAKNREGLTQFLSDELTVSWEGFASWQVSGGSVDCYYNAEIILKPTEAVAADKELSQMLKKNPFVTKEAISEYFEKKICKYLDDEFEEYCTCDDYYQPVVEDFELEYRIKNEWCKKNGFDFVSCEGDGYDDGYEPNFRRGWH